MNTALLSNLLLGDRLGRPGIQASNFILVSFTETTQTWKFTRGNGSGCVVVMRANSPVNAFPQNGVSYAGSLVFGNGDEIGDDNFVVLVVEGKDFEAEVEFTVTGLTPGDIMFIRGFEFNGKYLLVEPSLPPETQAVLDLLPGINDTQREAISQFVNSQVNSGNW